MGGAPNLSSSLDVYVFVKVFQELGKLLGEILKELEETFTECLDIRRFDNQCCFKRVFMPAHCVVVSDDLEGLWEQIKVNVAKLILVFEDV